MTGLDPIPGLPDDLVSRDDEPLFAFISSLRASVKARVADDQRQGLALSEIVAHVREMVRLAEERAQPGPFPAAAFPAISKQAIAWCVEGFQPLRSGVENDVSPPVSEQRPQPLPADKPLSLSI